MNKILFVLGSMKRGGAERVISILANHYVKKGWKVHIVLLLSGQCDYQLAEEIVIHDLSNENVSRIQNMPQWLKRIRSLVRNHDFHVILSFAARINIITIMSTFGLKRKIVVSERNDPKNDGRGPLVSFLTTLLYTRISNVVFQTEYAKSCFSSRVQENSRVIYNPVEPINVDPDINPNNIVNVGKMAPQKNQMNLLKAFKLIADEFPEICLYIYGDGQLRESLMSYIRKNDLTERVKMPGNIRNIHQEVADSFCFVLSSDYEGLSNALLEAMTLGKPCISTECAGSNEVIKNEENGLLIPIDDSLALYEAMKRFLVDRRLANRCGARAKETAELFKKDTVIKQWEAVLE